MSKTVILGQGDVDEAAEILSKSFEDDLFSRYYFAHLSSESRVNNLRFQIFKGQLLRYLQSPRKFLVLGTKIRGPDSSDKLVSVCVWNVPDSITFLRKFMSPEPSRLRSYWKIFKLNHSNSKQLGNKGYDKMAQVAEYIEFAERKILQSKDSKKSQIFKLMILGTDPEYQKMGFATQLLHTIMDEIYENVEDPVLVLEACAESNYSFYKRVAEFRELATLYFTGEYVEQFVRDFDPRQRQQFRHEIDSLKGETCIKLKVLCTIKGLKHVSIVV